MTGSFYTGGKPAYPEAGQAKDAKRLLKLRLAHFDPRIDPARGGRLPADIKLEDEVLVLLRAPEVLVARRFAARVVVDHAVEHERRALVAEFDGFFESLN